MPREKMEISVERKPVDGFVLSTIYKGQYHHYRYIGYTIKEAKALFRQVVKQKVGET